MKRPFDSGPPAPVAMAIPDVPIAPVAISFASSPPVARATAAARSGTRPSRARQVAGWTADLALLALLGAAHVGIATHMAGRGHPTAELVLLAPGHWAALLAALAVAGSWLTVSLFGRTPGMALTGQRLRRTGGGAPGSLVAFCRAGLGVLSASLGAFGFALALFDGSGRTLHDKLCGCACVVD